MAVIVLEEPRRAASPPPASALFALGFRPFYLLAAIQALAFVPLWIALLQGAVYLPTGMATMLWHGHEMVFGFACAVIIGFLFTAVRSWTGLATPEGRPLAALATLWLAARMAFFVAPVWFMALLDLALLPLVMLAVGRVLIRAKNRRNYFVLGVLAALWLSNVAFYAAQAGWLGLSPLQPLHLAVAIVSVLETVIAGRIVPMFTANALRLEARKQPRLDQLAIGLTAASLFAWALGAPAGLIASLAVAATAAQTWRCHRWQPWGTGRLPMLWILHLSHGWLILALALLAVTPVWPAAAAPVPHLLTVGAMSGLILGMITRTALGHTGRSPVAGCAETFMFVLLQAALICRVLPGVLSAEWYTAGLRASAVLWALCFALYLWRYAPILLRARIDGRPG
ncbi:NnrS family protein [Viridibacterium curvum]|uniref:NnrS family protein n=1 Tax=Viridibacterium curvum TaxID=1101404 RepID=A0ABP9QIZ6_9RHOO